jgi:hypothetical protein
MTKPELQLVLDRILPPEKHLVTWDDATFGAEPMQQTFYSLKDALEFIEANADILETVELFRSIPIQIIVSVKPV